MSVPRTTAARAAAAAPPATALGRPPAGATTATGRARASGLGPTRASSLGPASALGPASGTGAVFGTGPASGTGPVTGPGPARAPGPGPAKGAGTGRPRPSTVASASVAADASSASASASVAAASSPREPGRRLVSLARAARETAFACREAARAAGSAFRAARGGARLPAGEAAGESAAVGTGAPAPESRVDASAGIGAPESADSSTGSAPRPDRPFDTGYRPRSLVLRRRARDVVELVRAPAALTVPGDVLAGALAAGRPAGGRTLLLAASSVSLYWAGMALNDWADREEDAEERPERPVPSGRIPAGAALGIAAGLTAAGLGLGALAGGRRVLLCRTLPLAAAVWAYDLGLKRTPLGPLAMAAARALDVLHGTGTGPAAPALGAAATAGLHTWGVTRLSRHEVTGEAGREPLLALAVTAATALAASGVVTMVRTGRLTAPGAPADPRLAVPVLASVLYATSSARPQWAALRRPGDPDRVRTAVGAGIHALLPLQAALVARAGAPRLAVALAAGLPQAARLARKVSPT
ncbi:SCO3242 family prenyltransferase [Streptomyces collinus]|uniref:SCO3242 family prenyltransferase n=1 Tax=Streptomyces collinus TaxID=42684 RepID=UPI003643A659